MSHLTAPMPPQAGHHLPQKPYLFDLPRPVHPLTPPDTDYEMPHQTLPAHNTTGLETEPLPPQLHPTLLDSPYASPYATLHSHRKRPSVTYVNSSIREARERVVQRGLKWLVVVIPPVSFTREHGHLGHTLSSGPSRRLSSGILMPLYPTLNSQLGAIAREFQFPSIHGLCVYLQTTHGGVALSPRVSDDTWPLLWSHLFDARSPTLPLAQLPISGQIEFDIDVTKARWFDSWLASSRREYADVPQSVAPSRPQSLSHWRADSQGSINEPIDDQTDAISLAPAARANGRNFKKLSLLDRFDTVSVRSGSKLVPRDESPPSQTARQGLALQGLSPIVQEDEPATAKNAVDSRVRSWRMSATAAARSPMAATGQTSLDPVNMPNTIEDLPTASASEFELNLDDYTWSVSSVGPPDYDMESVYSWDRVPSVHMDRRGEGSVCLTASVCTSFGPDDDYEPFSPLSYISRLPSPDIAWRMFEDVPPTPTTATSWGAPSEYPPSPAAFSTAPSIDIAGRFLASRPVTPTTATSWGAPSSFPPSPVMRSRAPSPDLGYRAADSAPSSPRFRRRTAEIGPYNMVYPYYTPADSHNMVYPYYNPAQSHNMGYPYYNPAQSQSMVYPYYNAAQSHSMVFPYYDAARASTWQHVWPYTEQAHQAQRMSDFVFPPPAERSQPSQAREAPSVTLGYPVLDIYPAVYPSFDIYPTLLTVDDRKLGAPAVSRGAAYPIFDLYPAVYPALNIYPAALTIAQSQSKELPTRISSSYPNVEPYPAVYPHLTIYPAVSKESRNVAASTTSVRYTSVPAVPVQLSPGYPDFNIYPAVHSRSSNKFSLVNAVSEGTSSVQIHLSTSYPTFDIYPSVYPFSLDKIYPSVVAEVSLEQPSVVSVGVEWQYPIFDIYPSLNASSFSRAIREVVVTLPKAYPVMEIYPAAYPWSVYEIYPEVSAQGNRADGGIVVGLQSCYPVFNIYPAVYPYSLDTIYPAPAASIAPARLSAADKPVVFVSKVASGHVRKPSWKRGLPPVPPLPKNAHALRPVSAISGRPLSSARIGRGITVELSSSYPNVCPYPPVYPHLVIYPAVAEEDTSIKVELAGKIATVSQYPHLVIYPAVYPCIEIYPGSWGLATRSTASLITRTNAAKKPKFTHAELVGHVLAEGRNFVMIPPSAPVRQRRKPKYSHMELVAQTLAEARPAAPNRTSISTASPMPSPVRRSMPPPPSPAPMRPPPPVPTFAPVRAPSPARAPSPPRARVTSRPAPPAPAPTAALPQPPRRPTPMDLREDEEDHPDEHIAVPTIVAVEPSPTGSDADPESPLLFEMVTAPAAPPAPVPGLVRSRSRSGTINARPMSVATSTPPRPLGARPIANVQPPNGDLPPVPSPQRSVNRLSGLPSHPAVNRRIVSAGPRPMSTFGALPATPDSAPASSVSPVVRRQASMMSPLAEEGRSPLNGRSPQLPSPPDEWERGSRTPTDASSLTLASPLSGLRSAELNRSKTMPPRAAPRGPRGSTLISERARAFDNPNVVPNREGPLKLSMLDEFPAPPLPSLPSASPITPTQRRVSKLDRSKYPFE